MPSIHSASIRVCRDRVTSFISRPAPFRMARSIKSPHALPGAQGLFVGSSGFHAAAVPTRRDCALTHNWSVVRLFFLAARWSEIRLPPWFRAIAAAARKCFLGPAPSVKLLCMSAAEENAILSGKPMTLGASKHRRGAMALILCHLAALIALASGLVGPSSASAKTPCTPQNRVWENSAGMLQSHPIHTPQSDRRADIFATQTGTGAIRLRCRGEPWIAQRPHIGKS